MIKCVSQEGGTPTDYKRRSLSPIQNLVWHDVDTQAVTALKRHGDFVFSDVRIPGENALRRNEED